MELRVLYVSMYTMYTEQNKMHLNRMHENIVRTDKIGFNTKSIRGNVVECTRVKRRKDEKMQLFMGVTIICFRGNYNFQFRNAIISIL